MINKTKLALGIATATLTLAGALVSPQAAAGKKAEPCCADNKIDALEAQMQAMQAEINNLRAAQARPADAQKVQELDEWMAKSKKEKPHHDNTLFFRGGYGHANAQRGGTLDPTENALLGGGNRNGQIVGPIADKDAWYMGAGFDFALTDNVWGAMENTQVLGELMFDYKQYANGKPNGLSPAEVGANGPLTLNTQNATVSQFTLAASPKIKFLKDKPFRPWLIPVGFEVNVVSPPSNAITVLSPGMQFGLGADYRVWKDIFIGADARYHLTTGSTDGVRTDGVTAGGYLGIGF
ncbi:MAG: porin family protein [Methylobacter sp.]|nr:porin family protein [Methylobacter sp.]